MNVTTVVKPAILSILFLAFASTGFTDQNREAAAVLAAETFLQLVDSGQYAESWDETSELFKKQVSRQQWEQQLGHIRPAFGHLIKRELRLKHYTTSLPGVPDGEYVVIQFSASFENKEESTETVTPMLEKNGEWRVSGYYIR